MTSVLATLHDRAPLGQLARRRRLPCCSLVRAVCLEVAGLRPRPASLDGYASVDPEWRLANAWEGYDRWGAVTAGARLLGGKVVGPVEVTDTAPELPSGVWVVWQRWGRDGHTQLLRCEPDGTVTVVQSDVEHGLRIHTGGTWTGDAGLSGYTVAYATLPGVP